MTVRREREWGVYYPESPGYVHPFMSEEAARLHTQVGSRLVYRDWVDAPMHDPRCLSLTDSEFSNICDCETWRTIDAHHSSTGAEPHYAGEHFLVTETRRDGGTMVFRFASQELAERAASRLQESHRGRSYAVTGSSDRSLDDRREAAQALRDMGRDIEPDNQPNGGQE